VANILIIDDDRDILRMLEFAFRRAGHRPITTTSGLEGLKIVRTNPPQLIIVDIMMPEITGFDFTRQVRSEAANTALPILIYSARFQPIDRQTALEAGATEYVPKSTTLPVLLQKVNELLGELSPQKQTPQGQTFAFFSLRGGVGVTTLTVNIAVILAMSHKKPVSLTDLNPIAGHASLMLGLRPQTHLFHVLTANNEAPLEQIIKQHLVAHSSGVQLLASPLMPPNQVTNHTLKNVVEVLQVEFSFNLIDLPHILASPELELLSNLSKLILILSPDLPSLQSAVAAMKYLPQQGIYPEKIVLVLNQNAPIASLTTEAIQKTLRHPLSAKIPFEADMIAAANAGQPFVLRNPKSPAVTALARLARKLVT
jgi:pilus assembly protein CpaE